MKSRWLLVGIAWLAGAALVFAQEKPQPPAARMLERFDKNKDGFLDKSECPEQLKERFDRLDRDKDGKLNKEELQQGAGRAPGGAGPTPDRLFGLLDANKDGKLSKEELEGAVKLLEKLDKNKNGMIDPEELPPAGQRGGRPGEVITPAAKGERQTDKLKVGDAAPDFTLPDLAGKTQVTLSSYRGKKPVVLVFASYT